MNHVKEEIMAANITEVINLLFISNSKLSVEINKLFLFSPSYLITCVNVFTPSLWYEGSPIFIRCTCKLRLKNTLFDLSILILKTIKL